MRREMWYYEVVVNTADIISHTHKTFGWRSCKLIEVDLSFRWLKTVWLSLLVLKLRTNTVHASYSLSDFLCTFRMLQSSSQIVETEAVFLEFSPNFLHSVFTPLFSLKCAPFLPQCWATSILEHWDDCNTQINIGEGENHTSVSRFVTSIVFASVGRGRVTKRLKGNYCRPQC